MSNNTSPPDRYDREPEEGREPNPNPEAAAPAEPSPPLSRRAFLGLLGLGALGMGLAAWKGLPFKAARALGRAATDRVYAVPPPLAEPNPRRLVMVIDLGRLTRAGAERAREACHLRHNIPLSEPSLAWVKLKAPPEMFFPPVGPALMPSFCHHCDYPLCVTACPVRATFKRADGLVVQDPHRCLGCRFCQRACPFGARAFNPGDLQPLLAGQRINPDYPFWSRGVVAKCTFCQERPGQIPACQAAVPEAFTFGPYQDLAPGLTTALRPTAGRAPETVTLSPNVFYRI